MPILVQAISASLSVLAISIKSHSKVAALCVISLITGFTSHAQYPEFFDKQYKKGDIVIYNGIQYEYQYENTICLGPTSKDITIHDFSMPGIIKFLSNDLQVWSAVREVSEGAFRNCKNLSGALYISDNATIIRKRAFSLCSNLKELNLSSLIEKIEGYAFYGGDYHVITCRAKTPPECPDRSVFSDKVYENAYLLVPEESIESYKKATCWSLFKNIYPYGYVPSIISVNPYGSYMYVGESLQLKSYTYPHYGNNTISWTSDNPEIAQVDNNGNVKALKVGRVVITATKPDGVSAEAVVTVRDIPAQSLTLNKSELTLKANESSQLIASILPENATDKTITWISSNESIAQVDQNGLVTAVSVGNTTITATTANGLKAECAITVEKTDATGIVIDKDALGITGDDLEMSVGDVKTISVKIEPETATDKSVTFESSNPAVASIDADGKVTALSLGQTTIKITAASGVSTEFNVIVVETPAASISLNKTEATLKATETVQLEATILPETTTDKTVTWTSSDENTAKVDANGLVTAVAVGKATITATTANRLKAECAITVEKTDATGIIIDKEALGITGDNLEMRVGDVKTISVKIEPETATDKSVTFESSNPDTASVDAEGKVIALSLGQTTIKITAASGVSTEINVTVVATAAASISLNKTEATLKASENVQLEATILPETTTDKTVTWTSSDENTAKVDANGLVTAVAVGKATITATTANRLKAECAITVEKTDATDIVLSTRDLTLLLGQTGQLTATVTPNNTTDKTITWKSDNEVIATVDADGTVTALSVGVANITATCGEVSATCKVAVNPVIATTVTINVPVTEIYVGDKLTLTATVAPDNTTDKTVMWGCSTPDIASIDAETGELTALAPGVAKITATCGEVSASCEVTVKLVPASTVTIKIPDAEIYVGDKLTLTATVAPDNTTDKTVMWGCSTPNIVSIDAETGELTALAPGVAKITATCGEVCGSATVTVKPVPATSVSLSAEDLTLMIGQSGRLKATISPDNTTDPTIVWKSDNESVAIVSSNGLVTAVSAGTASVTATCGSVTATCRVTVNARPETPEQYVRKGNGASCTFVVIMNLTDEQLAKEGYNFAYGYTDIHGTDIIISTTGLRYCHTSAQIYNDSGNDFWVYAYWKKEDGSIVSSMRRHLDGHIDEEFEINALNESLSRSVNYENPENWIQPTRNGAKICLTSNYNTGLYVHTMDGMTVLSKFYDRGVLVQEELISGQFVPGTYVVTVVSGEIKKSKKIIVR